MRLTKVTLWNFRSFGSGATEPSVTINLAPGVNYFAGANNVGKSNFIRAVALALDPSGVNYDMNIDRAHGATAAARIMLEFEVGTNPSPRVQRLLKEVGDAEAKVLKGKGIAEPPLATQGTLRFDLNTLGQSRIECFRTHNDHIVGGNTPGRPGRHAIGTVRFHELVRFVDIKSGEDLQSLLQRGFKEILGSAVGDEHTREMKIANEARDAYIAAIGQVLRPVARHVQDRIKRYVRDIHEVDLVPYVPRLEDAIADARVVVEDTLRTPLEQKGTGVRGAMLLLLLSFIAESSKNAVVFGIEEPEAFLHPDAHRELGVGLERFTQRNDVTLLVTTHSPFLFRSDGPVGRSAVFVVRKDEAGRSHITRDAAAAARTDLLGSEMLSSLLERAEEVPDSAKLILLVEGESDARYLQIAAQKLSIPIDDIHIVFWKKGATAEQARGANFAAVQAVTLGARHAPARVVAALFDTDEDGKRNYEVLAYTFSWKKKKPSDGLFALTYEQWLPDPNIPVEAEDIFENATLDAFLAEPGNIDFLTGKKKRGNTPRWHYDLSPLGKRNFCEWLDRTATPAMFEPWRAVLGDLRKLIPAAKPKK